MIDRLLDHFEGEDATVACVYCDFQDQERQTAANMIGALTKQLVNALEIVPTEIEEALERAERKVGGRGLQVSESVKLLRAVLAPVKRTFICIDALDECPDKHLSQLLSSLNTVLQAQPGLQLFITGRPHIRSVVGKYLPGGVQVIPISPNREDIKEYLEMELEHDLDSAAMSPALRADIMKRIPEKIPDAYVMANPDQKSPERWLTVVPRFLLVSLSISAILGEATIHKRREKLNVMTNGLGLDGVYDATLDRIKVQSKGKSALAMAALMWISHSERPMRVGELCDALAVEIGSRDMECDNIPTEKTLLASCLGLVTVDESSTVRLVHFTLQEHFNNHSGHHFENPQSTMAEVCLTYLNFDSINELSHTLDGAPVETWLLRYASSYWGLYARNGLTEGVKSLALQLLGKFGGHISAKHLLRGSFGEREGEWRHSEEFTGLHCAAFLGLDEIAITLLEELEGCGADMADGRGRTPLVWAAESGHEGIVKMLLDRKEVDPDSRDESYRTPLLEAALGGHEGVVRLLLDRKEVNPDSRDKGGQTPLSEAAKNGHEGVVRLLLDRGEVNPDSRNRRGQTALWWAAVYGHEVIVKLLLYRKEVNPDSKDDDGQTPLWFAASGGHEGVLKQLLDRKEVNPDSRDSYNQTPLWAAAWGGHEEIVKLLLDRKEVNPGWGSYASTTPLSNAAKNGHERVVKLLLGRGEVNPDSRDISDQTPLQCAAKYGHEGIVKLLQGRAHAGSGAGANDVPMPPPPRLVQSNHEGLAVPHLSPRPPRVVPDMLTQNTHSTLLPAVSPHDTPDTSSEISSQAPPLDSPPLVLPNSVLRNAITASGIAAAVAILAITIRMWL